MSSVSTCDGQNTGSSLIQFDIVHASTSSCWMLSVFGEMRSATSNFCENESLVVCVKSLFVIPHTLEEHMLTVEKVVNVVIVTDCYGRELSSWCNKDPGGVVVFVQ